MRIRRGRLGVILTLALSAGWGCASADLAARSSTTLQSEVRARGLDPQTILLPFAVNEEMREWLRASVGHSGDAAARLQELVRSLLDGQELKLEYESNALGTAEQAFRSQRANCLAFTNLFVAMGRALGLEVYFLEVDDIERFVKEGDLVVISGHVTAGYGPPQQRIILDFTPGEVVEYRNMRQLADITAIALFYSNRGAQLLRDSDAGAALPWLETAARLDPDLAGAWINLGVARRRNGDTAGAEVAYHRALEADPSATSAYLNLAALLRLTGRSEQADELMAITDRRDNRNPFNYLDLGDLSLRHGQVAEAERFFRRALRLDRENAEPYAALGLLSLARRDAVEARRWLKRARQRDPDAPRVEQLARALGDHTARATSRRASVPSPA